MAEGTLYASEDKGYRVEVRTTFDMENSNPLQRHYLFHYRVRIANLMGVPARLESRTWHIEDALGSRRKVEGPGVVGQTPWFSPGGVFEYSSFSPLPTLTGKMWGSFHMRAEGGEAFDLATPEFRFAVPDHHIDRY